MALVAARNYRLECEEPQEKSGQLISAPSPIRGFIPLRPARPQTRGASCLLTP
jgi:hypothetical protein